ncbi:MAG: helix-turn-helix domain-containing protein [Bacteroidota bacterium]
MAGTVSFIPPGDASLRPFVKGYYFHYAREADFRGHLAFYQNITSTITIYRNTVMWEEDGKWYHRPAEQPGLYSYMAAKVNKVQEVYFQHPFERIAIVFHPGGINHILPTPLSHWVPETINPLALFQEDFAHRLPPLFDSPQLTALQSSLDDFLLQHWQPFPLPYLLQVIEQMVSSPETIKVGALAKSLGISRRTLLRQFQKHLVYSPEEYLAVIKFRKALLNYQQADEATLVQIAHESGYYDQADFNHHLKERSGLTPSQLFAQLRIMDQTLFWSKSR